jgi:hypothetical protein
MRKVSYRGHEIELLSHKVGAGRWVARAAVKIEDGKKIPILGRRRTTFGSPRDADSYALELAKLWVDGRLSGANGH